MSERSPNFSFPYLQADQAQKHVTLNDTLRRLDALLHLHVVSRTQKDPPYSPRPGERYLVPGGSTGAWERQWDKIAAFQDDAWVFYAPATGWSAWIADETRRLYYDGARWVSENPARLSAQNARFTSTETGSLAIYNIFSHAKTHLKILDASVSCSGASSLSTAIIPANSSVLAVSSVVSEELTGVSGWNLGVIGDSDRYGTGLSSTLEQTHVSVLPMPTTYYQDTRLQATAVGGSFTSGQVRLAVHLMQFDPPEPFPRPIEFG